MAYPNYSILCRSAYVDAHPRYPTLSDCPSRLLNLVAHLLFFNSAHPCSGVLCASCVVWHVIMPSIELPWLLPNLITTQTYLRVISFICHIWKCRYRSSHSITMTSLKRNYLEFPPDTFFVFPPLSSAFLPHSLHKLAPARTLARELLWTRLLQLMQILFLGWTQAKRGSMFLLTPCPGNCCHAPKLPT